MGIFGSILDRIFHHSTAQAATPSQNASQPTSGIAGAGQQSQVGAAAQSHTGGSAQPMGTSISGGQPKLQNVDVEACCSNWRVRKAVEETGGHRSSIY